MTLGHIPPPPQLVLPVEEITTTSTPESRLFSNTAFEPPPSDPPTVPPSVEPESSSADLTEEEVFEKVFGQPQLQERPHQLMAPLLIDGKVIGEILVMIPNGHSQSIRLPAAHLLEPLSKVLDAEKVALLTSDVSESGQLSLQNLSQQGLQAQFDEQRLEMKITIPSVYRKVKVSSLGSQSQVPGAEAPLTPNSFSGYLNVRGGETVDWSEGEWERQPVQLDLDGALNYKGWVFEGAARWDEDDMTTVQREDIRLIRDDPKRSVRYVLGDLALPTIGYQNNQSIFGMSVVRNFKLQPNRVTRPINRFEFFLEDDAQVEVFNNGQLVQTLRLSAGPQDIRDLPLTAGLNDVQLVITDNVGRVQRLDFSATVAGDLLAPGRHQFAYGVGFPRTDETGLWRYDTSQPIVSLSHRAGISPNFTVGGYLQAGFQEQLVGLKGLWAAPIGNVDVDVAFSNKQEWGQDYAFRLGYDFLQSGEQNPTQRNFGVAVEYRGNVFANFGAVNREQETALDFTAYYSQKLFWDITSTLNFRYQLGRNTSDQYKLVWGLTRSFKGVGVNLRLSQILNQEGNHEQQASLNFLWLKPEKRQTVQLTTEVSSVDDPENRLAWNYSALNPNQGLDASVGLNTKADRNRLSGNLKYKGYRGTWQLDQSFELERESQRLTQSSTQLTFGTAIVFVDGHWGISRPVTDSFALLVPHPNLKGLKIGVNPNGGENYQAKVDPFGPAVMSNLQSYQLSTLRVSAPDLPIGYEIGPRVHYVSPTYKSGTLIRMGSDASIFLKGKLLNSQGEVIALQAGEVQSLSDPQWKPITLFTNKAGKFAAEGFKPGKYRIRLFTEKPQVVQFTIPGDQEGIYDVGPIKVAGEAILESSPKK